MYIYTFVVKFLDADFSGNHHETIKQGVTCANNYKEAADNIIDYYGNDEIINMSLEELDEGDVIELSKEELEKIKEKHLW